VKRSSWVVLLLMLAAMVLGGWYFGAQAKANDRELPVYVTGGERMAAGQEIYRRGTDAKPFTYPPFAAAPFVPFAKLPAAWQPPLWFCINFLILVAMLRWLHRQGREAWGGAWPWRPVVFWALAGIFGGRHVVSVFTNQSNDLLVAGLVTMVAVSWCRSRAVADAFAGVFAGLGAALKATPLIFLGLFVLRVGGAAEAEGAWNAHSGRWRRCCRTSSGRAPTGRRGGARGTKSTSRACASAVRRRPKAHGMRTACSTRACPARSCAGSRPSPCPTGTSSSARRAACSSPN
jgi:hypothetical protein